MTTATQQRPPASNGVAEFSSFLDRLKPQLALALPKHLTVDRMSRLVLTAFSSNEKLRNCDPKTIAASVMTAGQLGLEIGVNGAGFLVPYGRTCTFVPGWKGLVDLVARSGRGTVFTGVIFKDQDYTFLDGAKRDLIIHTETDLDAPEDITHAYAIGWVKDATMPVIELWRVSKIRKHRDKYNKVGQQHYSYRDWEMYCRKVPLLQVLKYMPCSIEVSNAIAISSAAESGHAAIIEGNCAILPDGGDPEGSAGGTPEPQAPAAYPADQFEKNLETWRGLIAAGKKSAEQIIATAQTKGLLSDEQKRRITEPAKPKSQAQKVRDAILAAKDSDTLDVAADLIGEVDDGEDRAQLSALYHQRRGELTS